MNRSASGFMRWFGRSVERKAVPAGYLALHGFGAAAWTSASYAALSREGFMRNPVVHRCVRMVAEAAAAVPWVAYEGRAELAEHPALALIASPNPHQTRAAFLEGLYGHLLLSGNAFVEKAEAGEAASLWLLRPDRVSAMTGPDGWPVAVEYRAGAAKRRIGIEDGALLHVGLFHPLDDLKGFAPLEAALMALDTHNAAARWNKALLDNAARPSGALVYAPKEGGTLAPEQYEELRKQIDAQYSGASNAGRPMLLEGGLDWKAMGLTPKDMDFIEAKNAAARDIALAFGVPPMLLGIPGDNTYANYAEANRAFYRLTVLPLVARMAEAFAGWLGEGLRLEADTDAVPGLSAEREALWKRVGEAEFLTDDEKREAVGYGARG